MGTTAYYAKMPNGKKKRVPSVTGVLKYVGDKGGLMGWYFKQGKLASEMEADGHEPINTVWNLPKTDAEIGTIVHLMIECDLSGVKFDRGSLDELLIPADGAYRQWERFKVDRKLEVIATETALVHQDLGFGGTSDMVAKIDGRTTLVDFKTGGLYPDHIAQLAAYAALWTENHPETPLEAVALLGISKTAGMFKWVSMEVSADIVKRGWKLFRAGLTAQQEYTQIAKALR